ncbi:hypothetical protein HYW59_03930 [Candidatus Kaiserbacteria bacterium]|nr:hypothetical protein [Candidatus Kaiserbacteria bacterium]
MGSLERGLNRREFLKRGGAFVASMSAMSLLAACGKEVEPGDKSAEVVKQIDEFASQISEVKIQVVNLKKQIDATQVVSAKASTESLRKTTEGLRANIAPVLGLLVDNGNLMQHGRKTFANATERRGTLGSDTRFSPDAQQKLVQAWEGRTRAINGAIGHLLNVRTRLFDLLNSVQGTERYVDELSALEKAGRPPEDAKREVNRTAQRLTNDLKAASSGLDELIKRF